MGFKTNPIYYSSHLLDKTSVKSNQIILFTQSRGFPFVKIVVFTMGSKFGIIVHILISLLKGVSIFFPFVWELYRPVMGFRDGLFCFYLSFFHLRFILSLLQ